MARSYFGQGPFLNRTIWGVTSQTSVRAWTRSSNQSTSYRVKPGNLLANQTSHSAMETKTSRMTITLPNGNTVPISDYMSPGNSQTAVLSEVSVADSRAAAKLRMAVKDMTWDAAVFGAELGKTLSFFLDTARHLLAAYKAARKGDVFALSELYHRYDYRGQRRPPAYKRVANVWLQWRYAVRPAVMDFTDMAAELARTGLKPVVSTAEGSATEWVDKHIYGGMYLGLPFEHWRAGRVSVKYKAYYTLSSSHSVVRLGLTNLPALLWELTPYSFVIDNFLPIGSYLSGLDATYGASFLAGCRVERHDWSEKVVVQWPFDQASVKSYSRSPISSFPGMSLPSFQRPKGDLPSKVVDVIALLTQVIKRGG